MGYCAVVLWVDNADANSTTGLLVHQPGKEATMPLFGKRNREKQVPISDEKVQYIMNVLDTEWINLAASAWEGYTASGRGFLFMDFEDDTTKYIPASNPGFATTRESPWPDVQRRAKAYDPKTEFVLVLNQFDPGAITVMQPPTLQGKPTPPEAYRQVVDGNTTPQPSVEDVEATIKFTTHWHRALMNRRAELENAGVTVCDECGCSPAVVQYAFLSLCDRCFAIGIREGTYEIPESPVSWEMVTDETGYEHPVFHFRDDLWVNHSR